MSIPTVVHPRHPRGVAAALRSVEGIELREPPAESFIEALTTSHVLVTFAWGDDYLVPGLRWIQSISAGVDQFPLDRLRSQRVALTSASGLHATPVAEHAFALLLALMHGVGVSMRDVTDHVWRPRTNEELTGKTMLVLGLGSIGEEIARRAVAWGMGVIGVKRHPDDHTGVVERVYPADALAEVASEADVLVSVVPDSPSTRGMVDRAVLAALGRGWFVNVGRGSVVAEEDLLWALNEGELAGAGLDVFEHEPLDESSGLWDHPRVVITPHTGGLSPLYGPRLADIFRANLHALVAGGDWVNRVV